MEFVEHMKTTAVIRATKKVVARLNHLVLQSLRPTTRFLGDRVGATARTAGGGANTTPAAVLPQTRGNIRVFLASFMVAYRPESNFENEDGVLEAAVISAARRMIECFDHMCDWFVNAPPTGGGGVYVTMPEVRVFVLLLFLVYSDHVFLLGECERVPRLAEPVLRRIRGVTDA